MNSSVPAALVHSFGFPASAVGSVVGFGSLVTLGYLLVLPSLPRAFNQPRPLNLIITYAGMSVAWLLMLSALVAGHGWWLFVLGTYVFLAMANASQIVMLECLTGVCSLDTTTKIMGFAEMAGCGFGMAGSYFGVALLKLGMPAPFGLCGLFSFVSALFLALMLGRRRNEVSVHLDAVCGTPVCGSGSTDSGPMQSSVQGLRGIIFRGHSYISMELAYREEGSKLEPNAGASDEESSLVSPDSPSRSRRPKTTEPSVSPPVRPLSGDCRALEFGGPPVAGPLWQLHDVLPPSDDDD